MAASIAFPPQTITRPRLATGTGILGWCLAICLAGYWGFGKSFAYVGLYPVYVGEIFTIAGMLIVFAHGRIHLPRDGSVWICVLLAGIAFIQAIVSVVFLGQDRIDVLRNLAVVYYVVFGYFSYAALERAGRTGDIHTRILGRWLPGLAPWVIAGNAASIAFGLFYVRQGMMLGDPEPLPFFPGTHVPLLSYKPTDLSMPTILFAGLWLMGRLRASYGVVALLFLLLSAARSRSVMLGFLILMLAVWRPHARGLGFAALIGVFFLILVVGNVTLDLGGYREISVRQFTENFTTLLEPSSDEEKNSASAVTKSWRLAWWEAILADATSNNRVFLGGGWGSNPAEVHGFQTFEEGLNALRNPHNVFLGLLARAGWITAGLWTLFHGLLIAGLVRAEHVFRVKSAPRALCRLTITFLAVSLLHGSTDVFLESPQNAIPHWIAVGMAWSLIAESRRRGIRLRWKLYDTYATPGQHRDACL